MDIPDWAATALMFIPECFAINPSKVNTTKPLKNDVKPAEATHNVDDLQQKAGGDGGDNVASNIDRKGTIGEYHVNLPECFLVKFVVT